MINSKIAVSLLFLSVLFLISCSQKQKSVETAGVMDTSAILKRGDTISNLVQKVLLANVMQAMKSGGPSFAITYCSEKAMTLTDSLGKTYNCRIQRISDKYRNTANKPTKTDSDILSKMNLLSPMIPMVLWENNNAVYYKPIKIAMPACLKCHGSVENIDAKTLEIIRKKYPDDLATNYKEGDLRGLWKITFSAN